MKKIEKKNMLLLISSSSISRAGNIFFDYASNTFLAMLNLNSLTLVGLYQTAENVVSIIFNLFGGVIADRFRRKRILILTDLISGLACLLFSFADGQAWLVYSIIGADLLLSMLAAFSGPAYKAMTKESVAKENIAIINSNLQTASMIVKIGMPIIAIGIYRFIGIQGTFLLDGLSFFLSSLIMVFISPLVEEITKNERFSLHIVFLDLASGFHYLFQQKSIFKLIILSAFVNFFLAAYNLLLPYGNQMFPHVSGNVYGPFLAAEAVGGVIGAFVSGRINKKLSIQKLLIYLGMSGMALATAPIIYNMTSAVFVLSFSPAAFNFFLAIFNVQFFSFVQRDVDSDYLGRVFGIIFTVAILFMPIGTVIFTLTLKANAQYNLLFVGLSIVILAFIFAHWLIRES